MAWTAEKVKAMRESNPAKAAESDGWTAEKVRAMRTKTPTASAATVETTPKQEKTPLYADALDSYKAGGAMSRQSPAAKWGEPLISENVLENPASGAKAYGTSLAQKQKQYNDQHSQTDEFDAINQWLDTGDNKNLADAVRRVDNTHGAYTDKDLITKGGWTQEQIDTARQMNAALDAIPAWKRGVRRTANTIGGVVEDTFQIPPIYTGVILTVLIFVVSAGGLKRFAHVARKVVPFMATLYIASGLLIILINIKQLPGVFADIFAGAFGLRAVSGGVLGSMIIAMQKGIARGLYSNEAGEGSAPVLHSAADVEHPAEQGIAGVTEVFLDTFVICTITGLVLGVTGVIAPGISGNVLPLYAFESVWPPMRYVLAASLLLFSTTSLMSQWYFGFVGLNYMFGRTVAEKFKYIFPCFCIFGATLKSDMVWTIQDIALGLLTIPNLIAMVFLWPKVRKATKEFFGAPRT